MKGEKRGGWGCRAREYIIIRSHTKDCWRGNVQLIFVVVVYELTKKLPKEEEFGLKGPAENDGIPSSGERAPAWNISEPNSRLKIER